MVLSNERTWPDLPLKKFSLALVLQQTVVKQEWKLDHVGGR